MSTIESQKCVIIVDPAISTGLAMNAVACLSFSLGAKESQAVAKPLMDKSNVLHGGLINIPISVLRASKKELSEFVKMANADDSLVMCDMNELAQNAKTFEEYESTLAETSNDNVTYRAIALYGGKKQLNKMTGHLKLY